MRVRLQNIVIGAQDVISPQGGSSGSAGDGRPVTRPLKMRYIQADLPFPHDHVDCLYQWQTSFLPSLLSWAGAQADPFRTNCRLGMDFSSEVAKIWERVYPESPLDDDSRLIVLCVVCPFPSSTGTWSQIVETNNYHSPAMP